MIAIDGICSVQLCTKLILSQLHELINLITGGLINFYFVSCTSCEQHVHTL